MADNTNMIITGEDTDGLHLTNTQTNSSFTIDPAKNPLEYKSAKSMFKDTSDQLNLLRDVQVPDSIKSDRKNLIPNNNPVQPGTAAVINPTQLPATPKVPVTPQIMRPVQPGDTANTYQSEPVGPGVGVLAPPPTPVVPNNSITPSIDNSLTNINNLQQGMGTGGLQNAFAAQQQATQAQIDVQQKQAAIQAANADAIARQKYTDSLELKAQEGIRQQAISNQMMKYQATVDDVNNTKITPWASRASTGDKVGLVIAAMLAGFGGGLAHDPGAGMRLVDGVLNRDLEQQKSDLASKQNTSNQSLNLLGIMRQNFGDEATAQAATRAAQYDVLQSQLNAKLAGLPDAAKANGMVMMSNLKAAQAAQLNTLQSGLTSQQLQAETLKATLGMHKDEINAANQNAQIAAQATVAKNAQPKEIPLDTIKDLSAKKSAVNEAENIFADFKKNTIPILSHWTQHIPWSDSGDEAAAADEFAVRINKVLNPGSTDPKDLEDVKRNYMPHVGELRSTTDEKLQKIKMLLLNQHDQLITDLTNMGYSTEGLKKSREIKSKSNFQ